MIKELDGGLLGATSRAIKYGNLKYKLVCAFLDFTGYSNHELQDLEVRNRVYNYLRRHYSKYMETFCYSEKDTGEKSENVWFCWLQGIDNAPNIVKKCYQSIKQWVSDKQIHILDQNNLFEYIDLPDYVVNKWKSGIISNTLFSDFIRLSVLTQYGGIWIDATVLMTGKLPDYISDSDFFMFQSNKYDVTKIGESWLIKANAHNRILQGTLDLMNEYWKRENKIRDYFLMFIFMKMVADRYPEDMQEMPKIPASIPLLMQEYLGLNFNQEMYSEFCKISSVHKLTYKIKKKNRNGSLYQFLINSIEDNDDI